MAEALGTTSVRQVRTRLGAAIAGAELGSPTADELCVACVELLGVDGAAISVVSDGVNQGTLGASSADSRRIDECQFTFGEGPCVDAVVGRSPVLVPDLDSPDEQRWPLYAAAMLDEGIRAMFAWPITVAGTGVGALALFRRATGPLTEPDLAGYRLAAELSAVPFLDLGEQIRSRGLEIRGGAADPSDALAGLDRVEVHQAAGMLVVQLGVDTTEAMVRLRGHAIATGQTVGEVATAVLQRRLVLPRDHRPHGGPGDA